MKFNKSWFTLIEVIVSVSILSIIMVSIFVIFNLSADLNNKADISRSMQENIKNIVETIAEDIRKNWASWVNNDVISWECSLPLSQLSLSWSKLCIWNTSYYLAKKVGETWNRITDYSECSGEIQCFLVKNDWLNITQLSNSWVWFNNLSFYITNTWIKKVSLNFEIQPSIKKWIKPNLVKDNKIIFQTTLSERLYNDY